ncbi:MAG: CoA transferase, partial [Ignavibacteriae bacterium]|nr:CoA transferase [Ignavibacteriota bacterium]
FLTKDKKHILLAIGNDKQFSRFCKTVDVKNKITQDKFSTNFERVKNRNELKKIIVKLISEYNSKKLIEILDKNKIPAALIKNMKEVFEQEQAQELLLISERNNTKYFGINTFSAKVNKKRITKLSPPPHLDENRKEIFKLIQ